MSDPQTPTPKTPRAEPIQPDPPSRGNDTPGTSKSFEDAATDKALERERDALDNVREGYD